MSEPQPRGPTARQKQAVARRASDACEYCRSQARYSPDPFSVDHILPRAGGGADHRLENLALSCQGCNNRKYTSTNAADPATGEATPLFHARRQRWSEHFAWNADYSLVIGLTPTGRATVAKLQLNRDGVVNLRRVLRTMNQHPPAEETTG